MSFPGAPSWIGDLDHLNGLDEVVIATDLDGRVVYANAAARRLHGLPGEDPSQVTVTSALLPPEDDGALGEILAQAGAGRAWTGRLEVLRVDGSLVLAEVTCSPLRRGQHVTGSVWVVSDTALGGSAADREVRRLGDRLRRLARVAAELGTAEDIEAVTKIVIDQAADAVGATVASLSMKVDEDTLALVGLRGGAEGASARWATYPISTPAPAADVVRTGRLLVLRGRDAIDERYPGLEHPSEGPRSIVGLPLTVLGRTIGVVTLSFPGMRELDAAELEFFAILADSCAQAIERIRSHRNAEEQAARVRFLAEAATELSDSLDYERTIARVARLAVPGFADWCAIDLVEDDRLHRIAVEHVDPTKVQLAIDLERRYPSDREAQGGAWEVIRTGLRSLIPEITDEMLVAGSRDAEHLQIARDLRLRSAVTVPLTARGRVLGVMTWVAAESERRYTEADGAFAEDLAKRCAIAIDNAQLHSQTLQAAVLLQHAVLPDLSGTIPGWTVASHYSPAGRTEVGGDFFDAIALPGGRLAVFVGDVMGRGVAAAAAMAQMRASVRAYVAVDPDPEEVVSKLDVLMSTYDVAQLVTLVYLVIDPAAGELRLVNAGHPPPVILRSDGTTDQLPLALGAPLGVTLGPRTAQVAAFHRGDTLFAYTDGLLERRDEDIDVGQARIAAAAKRLATPAMDEALRTLVEQVRDHTREDDVAALAVRCCAE